MSSFSSPATTLNPSSPSLRFLKTSTPHLLNLSHFLPKPFTKSTDIEKISRIASLQRIPLSLLQCTQTSFVSGTESEYETEEEYNSTEEYSDGEEGTVGNGQTPPPLQRRRRRYRKQYPGEDKGITEEMRFVAMKLRKSKENTSAVDIEKDDASQENNDDDDESGDTWQPSMEGLLKYLVDSNLVFSTVERIVDESTDVSYVYFRKTGLERSNCISKDLEWLREQGNVIPRPSNPGVTYVQYLEELSQKNPPLFLCHFYNIYFSHIAGGQVITRKVSKMLLGGSELEINKWDGDAEELLRGVREKLNALSVHWSRDEKTRCLREATKAFRFLGQIVRLIIL